MIDLRTKQEKEAEIKKLESLKKRLPEFNAFGGNNYLPIDAQIEMLKGYAIYEDFEDQDDDIESAAYDAKCWLERKTKTLTEEEDEN